MMSSYVRHMEKLRMQARVSLIPVNCVNADGNPALNTRALHCGTLYMTTQLSYVSNISLHIAIKYYVL
jgi:hypothetical protein